MLVVETIAKIRRAYFAQNKPIKTICREFRVSRRVVRKVIRSQATEFRYERSRQPLPRIDPWRDQLEGLLLENEGKPVGSKRLPPCAARLPPVTTLAPFFKASAMCASTFSTAFMSISGPNHSSAGNVLC